MLYLASQSPRRHELLTQLGVQFKTVHVDIPETPAAHESPENYVCRVATEKAQAGLTEMISKDSNAVVLGADTEVVLNQSIFGKPKDAADAAYMLLALSGKTHQVYSAITLVSGKQIQQKLKITEVSFKTLTISEIEHYIATQEPFGKAGAYAIQGKAAAFITQITGSYSAVMGLPLYETALLLEMFLPHH